MSRILGVVAEYNPFHLGHAHHLQAARQAYQADYVVVVMSACFTQRGDAALLSPHARARMALSSGADAVFALPASWAVRDAEHFALGGVSVLHQLGCSAISFGTEFPDIAPLQKAANLLETPDAAFRNAVARHISGGLPYPAAVAAAANETLPGAGALLSQPNSTLAVCYLRALLRLGSQMEVVPVRRDAAYHATTLEDQPFPSATALRGAILRGDTHSAEAAMPAGAAAILREEALQGRLHRPEALDTALLARLRTMTQADYERLPDLSEGIEHRLQSAAASSCSRTDLLSTAKTRRYPFARLSRLATHALLGFTHDELSQAALPAPWLLGYRSDARELIGLLSRQTPLLTRSADLLAQPWFQAESRAWDLWALGAGLPGGLARTSRLITL